MEGKQKNKIFLLGGLCLVLLVLVLVLTKVGSRTTSRQRAAGGPVSVSLIPDSGTVNSQGLTVSVRLSSSQQKSIRGAQVAIAFPVNVFEVSNVACNTNFPTQGRAEVVANTIHIACAQAGGVAAATVSASSQPVIASFVIKPRAGVAGGTQGTVSFIVNGVIVPESGTYTDLSGTLTGGTYTVAGAAVTPTTGAAATPTTGSGVTPSATATQTPAGRVDVFARPDFPQVVSRNNTPFSTTVRLNTGTHVARNVRLEIHYDSTKIDFVSVTPGAGFTAVSGTGWSKSNGKVTLEYNHSGITGADVLLATLNLKMARDISEGGTHYVIACVSGDTCRVSNGTTAYTVYIVPQEGAANRLFRVGFTGWSVAPSPTQPAATVTQQPAATATQPPAATATQPPGATVTQQPAATATQPPTGSGPTVNFSVKLQGISQKRADQKVSLIVRQGDFVKTFENIDIVSDNEGIYTGSVVLAEVPPATGYTIFIKGPKHISRKFCSSGQASRCGSSQSGTLTLAAVNTFDFSKMDLMAGDLPRASGGQDGVVNSLDYQAWKGHLGGYSTEAQTEADVNLDGIANVTDWGLMRITMETELYDSHL